MGVSFIWDVDGTLLDSYPIMLKVLMILKDKYHYKIDEAELLKFIKIKSINDFLKILAENNGVSFEELLGEFKILENGFEFDSLINNTEDVLSFLKRNNVKNYIYTHRDTGTYEIFNKLDILKYFEEVITKENGFKRKPESDALDYLIDKYHMDKNTTFYVGDRPLDIECAKNAGIKSILLSEDNIIESCGENYLIKDLNEIKDIINYDLTFKKLDKIFNVRCCGIIKKGDKFLLAKREGYYSFIGGRLKINETFEEGIIREIEEELNTGCKIIEKYDVLELFYKNIHELNKPFLIELDHDVDDKEYVYLSLSEIKNLNIQPIEIVKIIEARYA